MKMSSFLHILSIIITVWLTAYIMSWLCATLLAFEIINSMPQETLKERVYALTSKSIDAFMEDPANKWHPYVFIGKLAKRIYAPWHLLSPVKRKFNEYRATKVMVKQGFTRMPNEGTHMVFQREVKESEDENGDS
jgi:hypothetical protein